MFPLYSQHHAICLNLFQLCIYTANISKDKDKEALFNVAYNVIDNISSRTILRHNIFNRYPPVFLFLYLPSTTPLYASLSKGAASTIFYTFSMVRPSDSNPRPPAPKADALLTELSRRKLMFPCPQQHIF